MRTILLTGKNGQVGWELQRTLATLGKVIAMDRQGMDLANPDSIRSVIRKTKPNIIVNAAAYTAVDKAESEPDLAMQINGVAPGILAEEAIKSGALLVHFSTDYVFDGSKRSPYLEEDAPHPINVYGNTKLAGENAILATGASSIILRTSWVYGLRGQNFLVSILRRAQDQKPLRVVADQIGAPTWSRLIAETTGHILSCILSRGRSAEDDSSRGVFHLTASGHTSWHGFARAIVATARRLSAYAAQHYPPPEQILSIASEDYPSPARRPKNSALSNAKLLETFGLTLPDWGYGLKLCMEESDRLLDLTAPCAIDPLHPAPIV